MIDLDIIFEEQPWERCLEGLQPGERVSAGQLLTVLEGEPQQTVEDALDALEKRQLVLDAGDLPRTLGSGEMSVRLRMEKELAAQMPEAWVLEPEDPLRMYMEELASIPAAGDVNILADEATHGNERAGEMLINLGLSRVVEIAREYVGYGVLLLDLIQEGNLGLLQSVGREYGADYCSFRDEGIRRAMARSVLLQARANGVGQKLRTALEDFHQVDQRLLGELGRNPTLEEIAEELHMSPEEASSVQKMLSDARTLVRMKPEEPEQEKESEAEQAVEDTALFQSRARVLDMLSGLTEREAAVLTARFGLEGGKPLTAAETGARLGMTAAQVSAMEAAALEKLRH